MNGKILVACIGNIFLGDDAFGEEVAQRLVQSPLPEGVTVHDFANRGYYLAYALMQSWDLVILVEALPAGEKPGTLYAFEPELTIDDEIVSLDAHAMKLVSVFQLVHTLGGKLGRVLVVGCEPASLEPNHDGEIGLSPSVRGALSEAVRMVHALIARAGSRTMAV